MILFAELITSDSPRGLNLRKSLPPPFREMILSSHPASTARAITFRWRYSNSMLPF